MSHWAESGPSLQVQSLTSIKEEADLQHKTHVRGVANSSFGPFVSVVGDKNCLDAAPQEMPA